MKEVKRHIYFVGSQDKERKLFDQLIPLPDGTSYNAYLIKGSEKTALIDTVYPEKSGELIEKLNQLEVKNLDYIISDHAEQDHSGTIPKLLEIYPQAKVVTNAKCKGLIKDLLLVSEDKFIEVKDGDTLSLGDKTFEFMLTPWVHWPDTMMTYLREEKILFSCDFLGSHIAGDELFVTDKEKVYESAKRYYAEIMMPFRTQVKKYLERLNNLDIDMIAPSHGPIYQEPEFILDAYKDWSSDKVKNEVVIAYVTMYDSTRRMVDYLSKALNDRNITVNSFNVIEDDIGELAMAMVDTATLVLGSPYVLGGAHPNMVYAAYLINALKPKTKFLSILGSYGWGGTMVEQLKGLLGNIKAEFIEPVLLKGYPKAEDFELLDKLADQILEKHKEILPDCFSK